MKKVIVTGANGFIGSRFVKYLSEESIEVLAIVKNNKENVDSIAGLFGVHIIYCDMSEYDTLPQKISNYRVDIDVFYHFAWAGVFDEERSNYQVQLNNMFCSCKAFLAASNLRIQKFIYITSIHEYGVLKQFMEGTNKINSLQLYGVGKLTAHLMLSCLASDSKTCFFPVVITNVYAANDLCQCVINKTIQKLLTGNTAEFTHGRQLCDFIYLDDVIKGIKEVGLKGIAGHNYYLGSCQIMPLYKYLERLKQIVNPDAIMEYGKIPFPGTSLTYSEFDIHQLYIDTGFKTEVLFEEGIKKIVEWMKNNH